MAQEIASLYASIGADTSGLKAGLENASRQLKGTEQEMRRVGTGARNAESGLKKLGNALRSAGIIAGAVKFGKMVYEMGEMGAAALRTEATFERVAGGAGAAASMLDQLKAATMGTRSEAELMASATNLMALGLADNAADLGNVMRSVEGLGSRFGGNMQIFQLMMSNDSLMRIDSFGIGVEEATKRIEEYKAAGMEAGEAFDTAILDLMGEKFDALGGNVEDATTSIQRNAATWADLKTQAGIAFSGLSEMASGLGGGFIRNLGELLKKTNDLRQEFGYWSGTFTGFIEAIDVFDIINTKIDDLELNAKATAAGMDALGQGFSDVGASAPIAEAAIRGVGDAAAVAQVAFFDAAAGLSEMSVAAYVNSQLELLKVSLDSGALSAAAYAAAQEGLLRTFGLLTDAEVSAQDTLDLLRGQFISGQLSASAYAEAVKALKASIDGLQGKDIEIGVTWNVQQPPEAVHRGVGGPIPETPYFAEGGFLPVGGYGIVGDGGGPEMIYASSAGVAIKPLTGAGVSGDGGSRIGSTWYGDIVIQGAADPDAAAQAVIQKLADRGIVRTGGFR